MEPGPRMKRNSPSVSITSVVAEGTISGIPSHLEGTPEKPKPKSVNQSSVEQWSGGVIVTEDFYGKNIGCRSILASSLTTSLKRCRRT